MRALLSLTVLTVLLTGCVNIGAKGPKPTALLTLHATSIAASDRAITGLAGDAITIGLPLTPQSLAVARIPVTDGRGQITYLTGVTWVEPPSRLFKALLTDAIATKTGRLILDPRQTLQKAGSDLTGQLLDFGIDLPSKSVIVTYDALLTHANTKLVASRRFQARVQLAALDGPEVSAALNQAANDVATQIAEWVRTN